MTRTTRTYGALVPLASLMNRNNSNLNLDIGRYNDGFQGLSAGSPSVSTNSTESIPDSGSESTLNNAASAQRRYLGLPETLVWQIPPNAEFLGQYRDLRRFGPSENENHRTEPASPGTSMVGLRRTSASSKSKVVYVLNCIDCRTVVCKRGMKAVLLANTKIELFSTDFPSPSVAMLDQDYSTPSCRCRLRDIACRPCGNVLGYHVTNPCKKCLNSCNNGHIWMFNSSAITASIRLDQDREKVVWTDPVMIDDLDFECSKRLALYEDHCR